MGILQQMAELSNMKSTFLSGIEYFGLAQNKNSNDLFTFTLFLFQH